MLKISLKSGFLLICLLLQACVAGNSAPKQAQRTPSAEVNIKAIAAALLHYDGALGNSANVRYFVPEDTLSGVRAQLPQFSEAKLASMNRNTVIGRLGQSANYGVSLGERVVKDGEATILIGLDFGPSGGTTLRVKLNKHDEVWTSVAVETYSVI